MFKFAGFDTLEDAKRYKSFHGGWIFHAASGEIIWYNPTFTPSSIMLHHTTYGLDGKLI